MSALGRKRTVILVIFEPTERPLSGKADIAVVESRRAANDCGLKGSTQHPLETALPGFRASGFCRCI